MPRMKQRTPALHSRVLQVALAMLESEGVRGFTARRIAEHAETSMPAVYELFGDKAGLLRELFFEGFRLLGRRLKALKEPAAARQGIVDLVEVFRGFAREHPVLTELMFSRPFADFEPGPADRKAGTVVREFIIGRVRRCIEAGVLTGDHTDIAHVLLALCQGLALQERAGWLGTSNASIERRWHLAVEAALKGFS